MSLIYYDNKNRVIAFDCNKCKTFGNKNYRKIININDIELKGNMEDGIIGLLLPICENCGSKFYIFTGNEVSGTKSHIRAIVFRQVYMSKERGEEWNKCKDIIYNLEKSYANINNQLAYDQFLGNVDFDIIDNNNSPFNRQ